MANHSKFGRAGPRTGRAPRGTPRGTWLPVATLAALALIAVACTETDNKPLTAPPRIGGPSFAADIPFNAGDKCIAADAFLSGFTNGVNDSLKLASDKLCTSNDIRIAQAVVDSISQDGGINYVKFTGQNVSCNQGDVLFLQMAARVAETATSQRTDIGIWIGLNGGNARVGQCNHYNLVSQGIPLGQTVAGVTNVEGDQCGDMNAGDTTLVQLGKIQVLCQTATSTDTLVHIGSCLGWTQPGGDQVCPQNPPGGPNGFRWGTAPGTGSKCNCEGFNVPITVKQFAKLEVVKACVPSQITGATFDLLIDASNQFADNVSCGGTTGIQELDAGTNANPGKQHSHGEGDFGGGFTSSDYTSSFACVNRGTNVSRGSGTSLGPNNITLQPNDDVVCTYTNTLKPRVKLVKVLNPTTDGGKFDFTLAGTSFDNSGAGYGHNGTTGFQIVAIGSVSFSEAAHTGTSLGDYTTALACVNAANQTVASNPNGTNTAGSVTVAAGDQITCTFTNTRKPQLKLVKVLSPTNDPGKFDFTLAGTPFDNGGAGYGHNGTTGFQNVAIGSVSFSEAAHTGTLLSDYTTALSCVNAANQTVASNPNGTNTAGSVTVAAGDQITCTFTNTKGAVLKLVKVLNPTTDGGKFDFTLAGTPFNNGGAGYGHNGTTGFQPVALGSVSFSEAAHTGTSLGDYTTALSCVNAANETVASNPNGTNTAGSVTVAAGDQITCTFTNTRKPQVKLVKVLNPTNDAGKFDFTLAGTLFDNGGAGYGHNGTTGFQNVAIGSVSFSEAAHTGTSLGDYGTALACVNASNQTVASNPNGTNTAGSVTVAAGDQITCTFTNSRKAQITVAKTCTGGSGATFGYSLSGPSGSLPGFNRDCGASSVAVAATTAFGTYTINETTIPASWAFDNLQCSGGGANTSVSASTATVGLDAGESVTCTYTNKLVGRAQIAPTATTCEQFNAGTSQTLVDLLATVNNGKIQTVSPGVFFYYAEVSKGAGQSVGFAQTVSPNPAGLPLYDVQQGQAFLYSVTGGVCSKVATLTLSGGVWSGGSGLAAGTYILGVKFTPEAAKGLSVPGFGPGALLATHNYSLTVAGAPAGGQASVNTRVKP